MSAVATNLFLGGWHGPFLPPEYGDVKIPLDEAADLAHVETVDLDRATRRVVPRPHVVGKRGVEGSTQQVCM